MRTPPQQEGRLAWLDVAKGLSIVLVVLWHVASKSPFVAGRFAELWIDISQILAPIRMPLFFIVSGLLASRSLARPWRQVIRGRVANLYYLYALWLLLGSAVMAFFPLSTTTAHNLPELLLLLVAGVSNMWYLYALACYYLTSRISHRAQGAMLTVAGTLSVLSHVVDLPSTGNSTSIFRYWIFFLVGAFFARGITDLLERRPPLWLWIAVCSGYLTVVLPMQGRGAGPLGAVIPLVSVAGVWVAATAVIRLAVGGPLTRLSSSLGRRTLPVYVLHLPLLAILSSIAAEANVSIDGLAAGFCIPLVAALLVAIAWCVYVGAQQVGFTWLFALPGPRQEARPDVLGPAAVTQAHDGGPQSPGHGHRPG